MMEIKEVVVIYPDTDYKVSKDEFNPLRVWKRYSRDSEAILSPLEYYPLGIIWK